MHSRESLARIRNLDLFINAGKVCSRDRCMGIGTDSNGNCSLCGAPMRDLRVPESVAQDEPEIIGYSFWRRGQDGIFYLVGEMSIEEYNRWMRRLHEGSVPIGVLPPKTPTFYHS